MNVLQSLLDGVIRLLPGSPFVAFIDALENIPFLNYLNWFIPVGTFIAIGEAWLLSIGIFYLYQIVLRWIRAIE